MTIDVKQPPVWFAAIVLLIAALVSVLWWSLAAPHRAFEYMVAGNVSAAIVLTLVYLFAVKRGYLRGFTLRIVRKSARPS